MNKANIIETKSGQILEILTNKEKTFFTAKVQMGAVTVKLNGSYSKKTGKPYLFTGQVWDNTEGIQDRTKVATGMSQESQDEASNARYWALEMPVDVFNEVEKSVLGAIKDNHKLVALFPEKQSAPQKDEKKPAEAKA